MSCLVTSYVPPTFDTSIATNLSNKVATASAQVAKDVSSIEGAISGLESELEKFKFDEGITFETPDSPPAPPSFDDISITPGTPTAITPPGAATLDDPAAPDLTVTEITTSSLAAPPAPPAIGTFSRPSAPQGAEAVTPPSTPDFSGLEPPELSETGDAPEALSDTLPEMPELEFDFQNMLEIIGYEAPLIPGAPEDVGDFLVAEAMGEYSWLVMTKIDVFIDNLLNGNAAAPFELMLNARELVTQVDTIHGGVAHVWAIMGVQSDPTAAQYLGNVRNRYTTYLSAQEEAFKLRVGLKGKLEGIEKLAVSLTVYAALEAAKLENRIAMLVQKIDLLSTQTAKMVETSKSQTAVLQANLEVEKAKYTAISVEAETFEQKVKTLDAVVGANRAAASGASSAAEAASAMVEIDEAAMGAAKARIEAAQAQVQASKAKEIAAELKATVFKGEVQKWRAQLSAASAGVTASKAELSVISAKNQALSQQVAVLNTEGYAKVADAQISAAHAQVDAAKIKAASMSSAAKIQKSTTTNQIKVIDARIGYLNAASGASAAIATNEAVGIVNDAITRNNQSVASTISEANSGVRQAAQSQASAATSITDIAYRYNNELAKAFAAINAGKLAGFRISTSKRMTGDMAVRFNMSARKDKSYSGSLSQSDDCETITTHEESV